MSKAFFFISAILVGQALVYQGVSGDSGVGIAFNWVFVIVCICALFKLSKVIDTWR